MTDARSSEAFDTGIDKIRSEIKSRLVFHGLFGTVASVAADAAAAGASIEITVKGRTVGRTFERQQIENCRLRVGGEVLLGIIAMIDELAA
jgi:hypothetical protein